MNRRSRTPSCLVYSRGWRGSEADWRKKEAVRRPPRDRAQVKGFSSEAMDYYARKCPKMQGAAGSAGTPVS